MTGSTILGQSGPRNNDYKRVLHISQSSSSGAMASDSFSVISRTLVSEGLPLCRDAIGVVYGSWSMGGKGDPLENLHEIKF